MKTTKIIATVLGLTAQCVMAADADGFTTPRRSTSPIAVPGAPVKSKNPDYGYTARELFPDQLPTERELFPDPGMSDSSDSDDDHN